MVFPEGAQLTRVPGPDSGFLGGTTNYLVPTHPGPPIFPLRVHLELSFYLPSGATEPTQRDSDLACAFFPSLLLYPFYEYIFFKKTEKTFPIFRSNTEELRGPSEETSSLVQAWPTEETFPFFRSKFNVRPTEHLPVQCAHARPTEETFPPYLPGSECTAPQSGPNGSPPLMVTHTKSLTTSSGPPQNQNRDSDSDSESAALGISPMLSSWTPPS